MGAIAFVLHIEPEHIECNVAAQAEIWPERHKVSNETGDRIRG
jgi:hypothetical protein